MSRHVGLRVIVAIIILIGTVAVLSAANHSANMLVLVALGVIALAMVILGFYSPQVAVIYLLVTTFFRLILDAMFPISPFLLAFAGVVASFLIWVSVRPGALPHLGWLEGVMALYLLWNVFSMFAPHQYAAVYPLTDETMRVYRFILTGTAIPFTMYIIGRTIYTTERSVRTLLWCVVGFGTYSAGVSIGQFRAPGLVWPRYIVSTPNWPDRANGIFNQPVVNGLTLLAGFVAALLLIGFSDGLPRWIKLGLGIAAAAMAYSIYLTHTRVIWLAFLVAVLAGVAFARQIRTGFVITLAVMIVGVLTNWSTFTSSDRSKGGVASVNEVDDRLNAIATSAWAAERKPLFGWGIGRFTAVNTWHHQQYSQDVAWVRGYGISSHLNELGILVELGLVGLILWLCVVVLLVVRLIKSIRRLPPDRLCGRSLGLLGAMLFVTLVIAGTTVDLRFFDFPTALVYLLIGIAVGAADRVAANETDDIGSRVPKGAPKLRKEGVHV